jgi:hypothetical protein
MDHQGSTGQVSGYQLQETGSMEHSNTSSSSSNMQQDGIWNTSSSSSNNTCPWAS